MPVTTPPADLVAAANREEVQGNYAYAASLRQEAADNQTNTAFTTGAQTALTNARAAVTADVLLSHVQAKKGHDGTTQTG